MEHNYWLEPCEHQKCPLDERMEYCQQELKDSPDDISLVIEEIDRLFESKSLKSNNYNYLSDKQSSLTQRSFETETAFSSEIELAGIRQNLELRLEDIKHPTRQVYSVISEWRMASDDYVSVPYRRIYSLELYPNGSAQCSVNELDIQPQMPAAPISCVERPMTAYDLNQLHQMLSQLQQIELADPDYVDKDSYQGWTRR